MQAYGEQIIRDNKNSFVKIISLPIFAKTQSIVLLDLATMDSYTVSFNLSDTIKNAAPVESAVQQSQEEIEREMQID
jgi:hypothetical protein